MDVNIRKAKTADIALLSKLNREVQQIHADAHPEFFKPPANDDFAIPFFKALFKDPTIYMYIAETDQPAGYIVLRAVQIEENAFIKAHQSLYIDQIGVQTAYRGIGVGKALIARAEALRVELGYDYLGLDTWGFNQHAQAFFKAQGFETFNLRMWKWD